MPSRGAFALLSLPTASHAHCTPGPHLLCDICQHLSAARPAVLGMKTGLVQAGRTTAQLLSAQTRLRSSPGTTLMHDGSHQNSACQCGHMVERADACRLALWHGHALGAAMLRAGTSRQDLPSTWSARQHVKPGRWESNQVHKIARLRFNTMHHAQPADGLAIARASAVPLCESSCATVQRLGDGELAWADYRQSQPRRPHPTGSYTRDNKGLGQQSRMVALHAMPEGQSQDTAQLQASELTGAWRSAPGQRRVILDQ